MIWFDNNRIPPGHWPFLQTMHAGLRAIEEELIEIVDITDGAGNILITGCMQAYRQAVLHRVSDLAAGSVGSWNGRYPIAAAASARALLETVATFHSFLTRAQKMSDQKDWGAIGGLVDSYAFFSSIKSMKNALTLHDPPRIGKIVVEFIKSTQPGAEDFWDQICDTCHPNGARMMKFSGSLDNGKYVGREISDKDSLIFPAIYNCLYSCCWLIASATEFEILQEEIATGGPLSTDHKLIVTRDLINNVSDQLSKETRQGSLTTKKS
ncbi:MAG: hypothetical protein AB7P50_05505 [Alphaproteobacteria bacterium]